MTTIFCIQPKGFNVGNDVIHMGLRHYLRESFGYQLNIIALPATARYESHATAGLTARTIHEINNYGHGVIVGGGNLYENGELQVDLNALDTLEVPLLLFSLSMGRIYNRVGKLVRRTDAMADAVARGVNHKATISMAREHATLSYLRELGVDKARLGGCPTLFLDRIADQLPRVSEADRGLALLSVRTPDLMNIPLSKRSQVREDVSALISLLEQRHPGRVRLLCHDHRDIPFAASFPQVDYVYTGDAYSYLALLRECAVNVTYRLHSFLPCLAFNRPAVKISYDERALSMLRTVGYDDWNVNMVADADVVGQVSDRLERVAALDTLRRDNAQRWADLDKSMGGALAEFAAAVEAYKAEVGN